MAQLIQPQVLKGFRDSLPQMEIPKKELMHNLERVFESFGFVPIDTPALEYTEVLLGKGGGETDKQVYRFEDNGGRDVSLRFDLTVPFARFMAAHSSEVTLPFKRYHMAKVWRGENTQRGRYREFYQCDFDVVGADSAMADFEILMVMAQSMSALGVGEYSIHLSHRGVFNRFLDFLNIKDHSVEILRIVDKLSKIGKNEVISQLSALVSSEKAEKILSFISAEGPFPAVLETMEKLAGGEAEDTLRLKALWNMMNQVGLSAHFKLDPSITRGLDYYTGVVFETFLKELPGIGSVCSGGRYNNLAALYTKENLPGVGASVGLDRLLAALEELGQVSQAQSRTQVLILNSEEKFGGLYHALALSLRKMGITAEVFLEEKKVPGQFKYAQAKGIPFVISAVAPDLSDFTIKDTRSGEARTNQTIVTAYDWIKSSPK